MSQKSQEPLGGRLGRERRAPVFLKLWEWNYEDVGRECEGYLGPSGFDGVQLSPAAEHVVGFQWWTKYQPVSYGLNTRSGSAQDFAAMVARCRAAGVMAMREMGGAPRNPAPRNHFLAWIVEPPGCHCTDGHLTSRAFTEDRQMS